MVKRALVLAASLLALASACGSSRQETVSAEVATRLAEKSEAVATKLRAGDGCGAAALARQLRREVAAAGLPASARSAAAGLAGEIVCVPPAPVAAQPAPVVQPQADERGQGHGKGKAKGHEKHGEKDGEGD